MQIKVTSRNLKPTATQIAAYKQTKGVSRCRAPKLNFGKVIFATDSDVDG